MCLVLVTTLESSSSSSSCSRIRFLCSCRMLRLSSSSSTSTRVSTGITTGSGESGPPIRIWRSSKHARSSLSMPSRRRDSRSVTIAWERSSSSVSSLEVRVTAFVITVAVSLAASARFPRDAQPSLSRMVASASSTSSSTSSNPTSHWSLIKNKTPRHGLLRLGRVR